MCIIVSLWWLGSPSTTWSTFYIKKIWVIFFFQMQFALSAFRTSLICIFPWVDLHKSHPRHKKKHKKFFREREKRVEQTHLLGERAFIWLHSNLLRAVGSSVNNRVHARFCLSPLNNIFFIFYFLHLLQKFQEEVEYVTMLKKTAQTVY